MTPGQFAEHLAPLVTPKDVSNYHRVLKDTQGYLETEIERYTQAQLAKAEEKLRITKKALNWADETMTALKPFIGYSTPSRLKSDVVTAIKEVRAALEQIEQQEKAEL